MKTRLCEGVSDLGRAASQWCEEKIKTHRAHSIYIPAGRTPMALYEVWRRESPAYLSGLELVQIDDVLTGAKRDLFRRFLEENLPGHQKQIKFIGDGSRQADLAVLGLGLNGHVAFHEPGLHQGFYSGCVRLNPVTCDHLELARETWGITYGAGAFVRSRAVLMMVSGGSKREILKRFLAGDPSLPASALLGHPDLTLLADKEALNGARIHGVA